jgi:hypothetical protein
MRPPRPGYHSAGRRRAADLAELVVAERATTHGGATRSIAIPWPRSRTAGARVDAASERFSLCATASQAAVRRPAVAARELVGVHLSVPAWLVLDGVIVLRWTVPPRAFRLRQVERRVTLAAHEP